MFHTFRLNRKWVAPMALMFAIMGGASLLAQAASQSSTYIANANPDPPHTASRQWSRRGRGRVFTGHRDRCLGGASESIALKSDGTVWTWGWDDYGILGNGTA